MTERVKKLNFPKSPFDHRITGSRYEAGYQHGRRYQTAVRTELELGLAELEPFFNLRPKEIIQHTQRYKPWVIRHLPSLMEEIKGIAEGADICRDAAFFLAVRNGLQPSPQENCTSFYCGKSATADGSAFIGQTKDTPPRDGRYFVMHFQYEDGLEMILLNYAGWIANIGMTSHGIAYTGNALYSREPAEECLPYALLMRAILESRNLAEVIQYLKCERWQDGCLQIAENGGDAICVELISGRTFIRKVTDSVSGHANNILTSEMRHLDSSDEQMPCSRKRQETIDRLLSDKAGVITPDYLRKAVSDHQNASHAICSHAHGRATRTTAAFIANQTQGWMDVAIGYPCSNPFIRYHLSSSRAKTAEPVAALETH